MIRQPIVSVLGHVDHGKTTLLDKIRGTSVARREAGAITQHIGATEVPIDAIYKICGKLINKKFKVPGLLFIDTPGHEAFTTLRARGGALADLAVLVIDINEGIMPQTVESINILKRYKTPFVIAANKIDLIYGWKNCKDEPFIFAIQKQKEEVQQSVDEKIYKIVEKLYELGFSADRYDRIADFTQNLAIIPMSAKLGIGIADLLLVLVGLAQRFLEENLKTEEGPGEGTVLEVKEERGLGKTIDVILYSGTMRKGDTIVVGSHDEPIITKIKAILKPKPLDEMRDPRDRFLSVDEVHAAAGIKIAAPNLENALAGSPVIVADDNLEEVVNRVRKETGIHIETQEEGVIIKADALGSLEALAYELKQEGLPIKMADIGDISKRDIVNAQTIGNPLYRVILGFNVKILPDAEKEASKIKIFTNNVVYKIIEDYKEWMDEKKRELEAEKRMEITFPGKFKILPEYIFRLSKPAIVGVRVLGGRIRVGQRILREDGRVVGRIKSIRSGENNVLEAIMGEEVAIAIDGVTVGRQVKAGETYYVDIPEEHARKLFKMNLSYEDKEVLDEIARIKRKEKPFWGL
ncbi:translation initiation factor IF-2 [Candidatus Aciduliprofundum boonei]|uniref:Probable translation initiation factor IF-2 n=1 Tax=Aciduliprofundum boonei (strain DSM 19572 / T469) TaxID=439481 RepID=D3T9H2_ACIB4|nr:translation initiation factor IF-2 [Candidatus Aciduliprofundum boonei]ADD08751.1 translation initiation factor aIF-2 [Aciduliprofundum boonei T469]HII54595.1 translation initiation factor IF-2 [Candidatus Aciduliprofundum boonei]